MRVTSRLFQKQRLTEVARLAGPRYEKVVNVELPIRSVFHALIKSPKFIETVNNLAYKLSEAGQYTGSEIFYGVGSEHYDSIKSLKTYIHNRLLGISSSAPDKSVRLSTITKKLDELQKISDELIRLLEDADREKKILIPKGSHQSVRGEINNLYEINRETYSIKSFLQGADFSAFQNKSFLLKGEAGIGKTHLLCDFANEAYLLGYQVYIFLGEEFASDKDPLKCIESLLGDTAYLQKINDEAKKTGKRAIILIDAINEAQTRVNWDLLNALKKYKHITFAISIRTGYEAAILSSKMLNSTQTVIHTGLNASNLGNIEAFFAHFKVPMPDVPLISHEFNNPLFVKIFCITYSRKKTVRGHVGSTTLFEDYVKKQGNQVKRAAGLPTTTDVWNTFIKPMAEWMGQNTTNRVLSGKALELFEKVAPGKSATILQEMERFWLLTKVPHYTKTGRVSGYEYRFPYQRFSDHLIVRYLLNHHLPKGTKDPRKHFVKGTPLGNIISAEYRYYYTNRGLVEAMAIQVPERLKGIELVEVAPDKFKGTSLAEETFLNSLLWRNLEMKNGSLKYFKHETVREYVNYYSRGGVSSNGFEAVLEIVISTAGIENHPLDADILHRFLKRHKMPDRDAFWLPFLYYRYGEDGSIIDRYINWASNSVARKLKSRNGIKQTAIVLSWFLASSDRRLRDRTTKALVNLLDGKYVIIRELLELFDEIDDSYIIERLYTVAYGCALRESNPSRLKMLAKYIYEREFLNNRPRVHILIRDYARGVVEIYHDFEPSAPFDKKLYQPPYNSTFPTRIISDKSLERKYPNTEDENESYSSIRFSVRAGVGDFGRYIIESNLHNFSNVKIDGTAELSEQDKCKKILASLTATQRKLVKEIRGNPLHRILTIQVVTSPVKKHRWPSVTVDGSEVTGNWRLLKASLKLNRSDLKILKKYLQGSHLRDNTMFNAHRGSRWIFQRAVRLGWDPAKHGSFDRNISRNNYDRHAHKIERIGKKYQWQAHHEFLARTADNYKMNERDGGEYNGPWQLHVRDIDISHTVTKSGEQKYRSTWWQRTAYDNWRTDLSEQDWMQLDDIPDVTELIKSNGPKGKTWLNLNTTFHSKQRLDHIPEEKQYNHRRREIWLMLKSYVIKKDDLDDFIKWSSDKNFYGRWMPESHEFYTAFYREYPYRPAFTDQYAEYYGRTDWHKKSKDIPFDLVVTDDEFLQEGSGYDHSLEESFSIKLPAKVIYSGMDIRSSIIEGQYKNNRNEIVFLDPHVHHDGTKSLLASSQHFAEFLNRNDYSLIWTVLGEKQILDSGIGRQEDWPGRFIFSGVYYLETKTMDIQGGLHFQKLETRD